MQKVPIDMIKPGMVLAKTILNEKGMALCAEGTELTAAIIERLMKMNVSHLTLKGHPVELGIETKTKEQRVQELIMRFSRVQGDPIMDKLESSIEHAILTQEEEGESTPEGGPG
jgi:dsDNA-specific endonuclease/ATPase MutS2